MVTVDVKAAPDVVELFEIPDEVSAESEVVTSAVEVATLVPVDVNVPTMIRKDPVDLVNLRFNLDLDPNIPNEVTIMVEVDPDEVKIEIETNSATLTPIVVRNIHHVNLKLVESDVHDTTEPAKNFKPEDGTNYRIHNPDRIGHN